MCLIISSDFSRDSHTYLNGKSKNGIPRGNSEARYNHLALGGLQYTIRPSYEMRISVSSMRNVTLLVCKRWHTAALNEQTLLKVVVEGYGYGVERHSQQFFIYIVVVSFCSWLRTFEYPDGRRKSQTCRNSPTNFTTYVVSSTPHHKQDSNSQL